MAICPKCNSQMPDNMRFCGACGAPVSQQYYSQPSLQSQSPQSTSSSPKRRSPIKFIVTAVVIIVIAIIVIATILWIVLPQVGINITTGSLNVRYNSVLGNDVKFYIDGNYKGTFTSDTYHTFNGISPGTHKVEVRDLNDYLLGSKTVTVAAGETTTVDISWGSS